MTEVRDQTINQRTNLDGNRYVNCDFDNCELVYDGGLPPAFDNCRFNDARFNFQGPAGATLMFLNAMAPAHTNMRQVVYGLIPALA